MPIEGGHLVGLYTHERPPDGSLIWVAEWTFRQPPTVDEVAGIDRWRWPVFFPVAAAIRRRIVTPIGNIPIPSALVTLPTMRSGDRHIGWVAWDLGRGSDRNLGPTTDKSLPILQAVNDTALRWMVEANWRPEDQF